MGARGGLRTATSTSPSPTAMGDIAKLSHPRLYGAVRRERLFSRIDELRMHPVVWIAGPPGSGKTTLVASYLERQSRQRNIWYQLDSGDADVSAFFLYLNAAGKRLAPGKAPLPLLTPEYLSDLTGFTRRYFRELLARLPQDGVLVLDNFQEIPRGSAFHQALLIGMEEIPPGRNFIVISRSEADAGYMRAVASGTIAELSWPDLRLTLDETTALCATRQSLPTHITRAIHESCDGWAAGLVLMLQRANVEASSEQRIGLASREAVFDYFATTFFAKLPEAKQRTMMFVSVISTLSAGAARDITGDRDAGAVLEELYRQHLFVQRVGANEPVYRLHGLFHAFLQDRAMTLLGSLELDNARCNAAQVSESAGEIDQAFELWRACNRWDECIRLVLAHSARLFAEGRWQTLRDCIASLPPSLPQENPWLAYWLGMCQFQTDQRLARATLSAAYDRFAHTDNDLGQMLTATSILIGYYLEYSDWEQAEPWIFRLGNLLERKPTFPNHDMEVTVYSGMLYGIAIRRPDHPLLPACIERTVALIERDLPTNTRMLAALAITGPVACMLGDFSLFYRVRKMLLPLLDDRGMTELNRAAWHMTNGAKLSLGAENEGTFEELERGAHLSAQYNLKQIEFLCHAFTNLHAVTYLDIEKARSSLNAMQRTVTPSRSLERFHLLLSEGAFETLQGNFEVAVLRHRDALIAAQTVGGAAHRLVHSVFQCGALVLAGRIAEAEALAQESLRFARECHVQTWSACYVLVLAWCNLERGNLQEADHNLALAIDAGEDGTYRYFRWLLQGCRKMLGVALQRGIRSQIALKIIEQFHYRSPSAFVEQWPWPVKVRTLGKFEIEVKGHVLRHGRKTPKRLLSLLQFVIANGGIEVSEHRIADVLWPDADGDEARQRLKLSLHRLRQLIGDVDHQFVQVSGGKVSINSECMWVDALCLVAAHDRLPAVQFRELAMSHYRGDFLVNEPEESWMLSMRARLRQLQAEATRLQMSAESETEKTSPMR